MNSKLPISVQICTLNEEKNTLELFKEIKMPDYFKNMRGSTSGIQIENEIWFITHENKNSNYYHNFKTFSDSSEFHYNCSKASVF